MIRLAMNEGTGLKPIAIFIFYESQGKLRVVFGCLAKLAALLIN